MIFNGFELVDYIQSGTVFLALGSEISKWFNNQRIGHKVNIQVPSCYGGMSGWELLCALF